MHQYGHYGAALLAYAPLGFLATAAGLEELAILGGLGAAGLSMLPDVDMKLPLVEHRGLTHTVWFALAVGAVLGALGLLLGAQRGVLAALGLGAFAATLGALTTVSHVAADALTPAGVRPFAPYREDFYSYDVARASNPIANAGLLVLGGGVALLGVAAGSWVSALMG